jgi:hypothetical protein
MVSSERARIIVRAGCGSLQTGNESTSIDRPTPWDEPFLGTLHCYEMRRSLSIVKRFGSAARDQGFLRYGDPCSRNEPLRLGNGVRPGILSSAVPISTWAMSVAISGACR